MFKSVTEQSDLPFKSTATAEYNGATVGVMHACGHDSHMAMLMGLAEIMSGMREDLPGTVLFIFQPAEEGAPIGERGGAKLMLEEGLFDIVKPEAVFAMHVLSQINAGKIEYRIGPQLAASDSFTINVTGVQSHGAAPWAGVDPIVASSQIVLALQTIVSRQANLTIQPAVLSIGSIHGGNRNNIIPEKVKMLGTLRTYDVAMREGIIKGMKRAVENIAEASGARAELVFEGVGYPVTINDANLTPRAVKSMQRAIGADNVTAGPLLTFSEDFSYYANVVPGVMVEVGCTPPDRDPAGAPANHSPLFLIDESAMNTGLRAMLYATTDYLKSATNTPE
jgi:amidohydrolase